MLTRSTSNENKHPNLRSAASKGDVSNKRQSQKDDGAGKGTKKQIGSKKLTYKNPFTAAAPTNGLTERGSKSTASASVTVDEGKARRSTRARGARLTRTNSSAATNGNKRSGGEASAEEVTRKSKRVKVAAENVEEKDNSDNVSGAVRPSARARAQDDRPERKEAIVLSNENHCVEEVRTRHLSSPCLVPPDYRLERPSFNGKNHTDGIAPHDTNDRGNTLQVAPYVTDIFQHFFQAEAKSCPEMYMDQQADINAKMRAILVDWLVEVHMKFRLVPDTLYLCINLIDRYCSHVSVARSKLQLVGVTALLIACKYEEIYPPEVRDCVYITDRAYNRQEVLDMEQDILQRLRFKITVPTAYPFLLRFLNMTKASQLSRIAANYYMERTLQEHDLLKFKPSVVAASAVVLALNNPDISDDHDCPGMPTVLMEYTGFQPSELMACAAIIATKVGEEPVTASRRQLVAVKRKYDHRKYQHVSTTVRQPNVDAFVRGGNAGDCI
eukprot:CAMPEP_0113562118 /NCGR_PEP_ID=MMETSP0015_2-20120614/20351_1 /TAXON_ID=2838 /ORGANISM="Odontella" /LENGTH=497 /DNA_ID=CAMNT_0000463983 /DNA_START=228 /DNA_END=1721 /DNA_ORIENTATION=- /assembly_acc=CAM_ASM_000160